MKKSNLFKILSAIVITLFLMTGVAIAEDAIFVDQDGNVGIGTTTPNYKLHVQDGKIATSGSSGGSISVFNPNNQSSSVNLNWYDDGNNDWPRIRYGGTGEGAGNGFLIQGPSDSTKLTILNSGKVGIGTTSPDYLLDIRNVRTKASAINAIIQVSNDISDSTTNGDQFTSAVFGGDITNAGMGYLTIEHQYHSNTPFRFSALQTHSNFAAFGDGPGSTGESTYPYLLLNPYGGNVGIGTTSPDAKLNIQGGTDVAPSTSYPGYIVVGDLQGYNIGIDNNEIMARNNGSSASLYLQNEGGNLYLQGTLWSSDLRLKENVYTLEKSLGKISKLRGVSFEWIDKSRDKDQHMGLIAQEVEDIFPELVETDEDGNKAIAYIDLIAPLIESVKELKAEKDIEIEMLVEQIEGLTLSLIEIKKENEKIKQELAELKNKVN